MKTGYFYRLVNQSQVWIALDLSVRTAWRLLQSQTSYRFALVGGWGGGVGSPSPRTGLGLRYKTFTRSNILIYPLALWPADRFQRKKSLDSIIEKILNMHTEVNNNCIDLTYFRGVIKIYTCKNIFLTKRKRLRKKLLSVWHGKGKEVFTLTIHIFILLITFFDRWSFFSQIICPYNTSIRQLH